MEGYELKLIVSPFSGYSGVYTQDVIEEIETTVRRILDQKIGYLNDKNERNYEMWRKDWRDDSSSD